MRIKSIRLENIKKFGTECIYNFDTAEKINTISGKNGSGKSTIVACASSVFFNLPMKDYFGDTANDARIEFELDGLSLREYFPIRQFGPTFV